MSLETVMLVMAIEEAFDLQIPNPDAERVQTVREMIDYVASRTSTVPSSGCSTQRTFHSLRRALRATSPGVGRIAPDTPLAAFADRRSWPRVWGRTRRRAPTGSHWPHGVPWKRWPCDGPRTVGELALYVTAMCPRAPHPRDEPWTRDGIDRTVRQVLCRETGIWNAGLDDSFVQDLGLD